jgi:hypothetical protein
MSVRETKSVNSPTTFAVGEHPCLQPRMKLPRAPGPAEKRLYFLVPWR